MKKTFCVSLLILTSLKNFGQQLFYSEPEGVEPGRIKYEIISKRNDTIIIYKSLTNQTYTATNDLYFYNEKMELMRQSKVDVPKDIYAVSFLVYDDFFYMFYQYQQKTTVYCMAAKIDMHGTLIEPVKELSKTLKMDFWERNQLYSIITSDNKKYINVIRQEHKTSGNINLSVALFNYKLELVSQSTIAVPVSESKDFLTEFTTDNEGNIAFLRISESSKNEHVVKTVLIFKKVEDDAASFINFLPPEIYIDDPRLKVDNVTDKYVIVSLYSDDQYEKVKGIYCLIFDKKTMTPGGISKTIFDKNLEKQISDHHSGSDAFDDVFIQNVQIKNNGGILVDAQYLYNFPKVTNNNRWNYFYHYSRILPSGFEVYDPYEYNHYYPWKEWASNFFRSNSYTGNNILAFSFDSLATVEWMKVIPVYQFNRSYYYNMGYRNIPVDNSIFFICNKTAKNHSFLSLQSINTEGEIQSDIVLRDVDVAIEKDYTFMPKYSKQIAKREVIIPCFKGHHICFARLVF